MALFQTHRDPPVSGEAICLPSTGIKEGCITTQTPKVGFKYFKPFKDYNTNVYKVQGETPYECENKLLYYYCCCPEPAHVAPLRSVL